MCVVIFLIRSNNNLASKFLSGCNPMQIISSLCFSFINIKKKKKDWKIFRVRILVVARAWRRQE